jgi:hypothetical protein
LPSLSARSGPDGIVISWPDWAANWRLWSATNLAGTASWSLVTNAVQVTNGVRMVLLPANGAATFFRLTGP